MPKLNFDKDWRFYKGDLEPHTPADGWGGAKAGAYSFGAPAKSLDDSKWRRLSLPHDFVAEGDYTRNIGDADMRAIPEMESIDSRHVAGGSLAGGVAWYRKTFDVEGFSEDKRVLLHFDGVYRNSAVYLNEHYVGTHVSGYTSFYYDITDFVHTDGKSNVLAVRVDATGREGWWYEGGGIYGHVWLEVTDNIHFAPSGVFVAPEVDLDTSSAEIAISAEIENKSFEDKTVAVRATIIDAEGAEIASETVGIALDMWSGGTARLKVHIENAALWDIEAPYLYKLKAEIYESERLFDTYETSFGVRHIRYDADNGFFLNGRHVKIKGLCCHHDHAGVGIGIPDSVWEYRIEQMQRMGANAYRSAHHQAPDAVLDVCDRLGMLVFDETRRMSSAPEDIEALREVVRHGRNHPSVVLWGVGNEEIFVQHLKETKRVTETMRAEVKRLDPTRPITSAVVCWDGVKRYEHARMFIGITDTTLDVMGFNYCNTAWDDYHECVPNQPIIITEEAANSWTRGVYSTNEAVGQYYRYDLKNEAKCKSGKKAVNIDVAEAAWKKCAESGYVAGLFLWTGIDYRGEPTPLAYPSVYSHFGILDYCAFPKDNFYYYKSWWQDEPVLHIFPHWNLDCVGESITVYCYSNADEVELFVNGKSYGRKRVEKNWYTKWDGVIYEPGEARAVGYKDGRVIASDTVTTTGAPFAITAEPYRDSASADEVLIINITITDNDGRTMPTADNMLFFEIDGGELVGTGNGDPADHDSENAPQRRAFMGLCQLLVKSADKGEIKVRITSPGLKQAECKIKIR